MKEAVYREQIAFKKIEAEIEELEKSSTDYEEIQERLSEALLVVEKCLFLNRSNHLISRGDK